MPRLRALDFELIKNGNKKEITKMVKDLLMLYPRGPEMRQTKSEYTVRKTWNGKESCLTTMITSTDDLAGNWGYEDTHFYLLLQGMGHNSATVSEWHFQNMLTGSTVDGFCSEWSESKWTRACRRLGNRMSESYKNACKSGKLGDLMFRVDISTKSVTPPRGVRWNWDRSTNVEITVPARTPEEAQSVVDACFGHAIDRRGRAHGWKQGGDAMAMMQNQDAIAQLTKARDTWTEIISKAQEQIDRIDFLQEAIETYTMSAFAADEDN